MSEEKDRYKRLAENVVKRVQAERNQVPANSDNDCGDGADSGTIGLPGQHPVDEIPTRIGRYEILKVLGRGTFGTVFLARDPQLDREVAIKVPNPSLFDHGISTDAFRKEAALAAKVEHRSLVVIYNIESENGRPYVVQEYIEGIDLSKWIESQRDHIVASQAVEMLIDVAEALCAAHAADLVHRDLKPANILLDSELRPRVADFGLALHRSGQRQHVGEITGTPEYMSPEQVRGDSDLLDGRTDIWSFGVILYEMLAGRRPFAADSRSELFAEIERRDPSAPSMIRPKGDIDAELERICLKCLEKRAHDRYPSAVRLIDDLRHWQQSKTQSAAQAIEPIEPSTPVRTPSRVLDALQPAPDPEKLSRSDVVITYADLDDQPVVAGKPGWISQLQQNLEVRVAQLTGQQVAVVKQSDPSSSSDVLEKEVLDKVPGAKTLVSVLSPPFVQADGCHRLVNMFWKSAKQSGRFEFNKYTRLLNVIKTPVSENDLPSEIRRLYSGLAPHRFYERDGETGRLREYDEAFGDIATQRFHERVYDVAYDISQVLRYLGNTKLDAHQRTIAKTIFLASTTSDLDPQRDQLRRELVELGHEILPKQPLPLVASELTSAVQKCLEQADLAIHFVGEHFGLIPEATELSVVALQNKVAAEYCAASPLQRLIWIPKGIEPRDDRQIEFIHQLESDPACLTGGELISDTLENLKVLLRSRWERDEAAHSDKTRPTANPGTPRVYIICDQRDEEAIEPLEDFFYASGIEVSLPGFEADESEVQQIHIQNLRDCDAALVFYGAARMHWVNFKVRDLQKAAAYRDSDPIPISAVYLAPPFGRRKDRFRSVSVDVIRQSSDSFDESSLHAFRDALKDMKDEG